jgi:hypothetical protein
MKQSESMSMRVRSTLVGAFILIAYGILLSALTESTVIIMIADIISGLSVIGIAVLMFPLFRGSDRLLPPAYLAMKFVEGLLMIAGGIIYFNPTMQNLRDLIYDGIHLYVFIVSGAFFYILLLRCKPVPGFISIWGMAGIGALAISTIFRLVGNPQAFLDYFLILIITNEVFLALWLLIKGFKTDG